MSATNVTVTNAPPKPKTLDELMREYEIELLGLDRGEGGMYGRIVARIKGELIARVTVANAITATASEVFLGNFLDGECLNLIRSRRLLTETELTNLSYARPF